MIPPEKLLTLNYKEMALSVSYRLKWKSPDAIVYIHGLGNSKEDLPLLWKHLEEKKHSVLMYDAIGFGNSSKPQDFSYTMGEQAIVLNKMLGLLGIEKIHILGYSMGGAIALKFHQLFPKKVLSFINIEGNLTSKDPELSRKISLHDWAEFLRIGFARLTEHKWNCTPVSLYWSSVDLVNASDSGELLEEFKNMDKTKYYVFGEKSMEKSGYVLEKISGIPTIMISNSSHFFRIDNPAELCKKIARVIE